MQLRKVFAFSIYMGSYFPLSLILLFQDIDFDVVVRGPCPLGTMVTLGCSSPLKNTFLSLFALGVCTLGLMVTILALRTLPKQQRLTVVESKHVPADLINYVIPYIVAFMSFDYNDRSKLLGFCLFLVWIFWITLKSGQIALNPVLAVLGWRLFEVKYKFHGSKDIFVGRMLSRIEIEPDQQYYTGALQDVIVVRENVGRDEDGDSGGIARL